MPRERPLETNGATASSHRASVTAPATANANASLALHRVLDSVPLLSTYRGKLFAPVLVATLAPAVFAVIVAMLGAQRIGIGTLTVLFVMLAAAGAAAGVWLVDRLLAPLDQATELLDAHAERRDATRVDIGGTDTAAQLVRGVQSLIARLKAQEAEQQKRDERDETTGLYGRSAGRGRAQSVLDAECRRGRVVRVVSVRIDHFGAFNDTHGYGHGDALLKAVGARVARVAGEDGVAMRWSGDEFMLVRGIAAGEPAEFEKALGRAIVLRGASDSITLSLGVAQTEAPVPFESLARRAAEALVEARRERASRVRATTADMRSDG